MERAVRRRLLLLPRLSGAGAGEGAVRGLGSLRPAAEMGTAAQEHPGRVVQPGLRAKGGGRGRLGSPRGTQGAPRGAGARRHSPDSGLQETWERVGAGTQAGSGLPLVRSGVPAADPGPPGSLLYQERRVGIWRLSEEQDAAEHAADTTASLPSCHRSGFGVLGLQVSQPS